MENVSKDRKCPKCNEHKTGEMFYNSKSFYCKPCANEFARERSKKISAGEIFPIKKVKNNEWYVYLNSKGVKYCEGCNKVKSVDKFRKHKINTISGRRPKCKLCEYKIEINKEKEDKDRKYKELLKNDWYKKHMKKKGYNPKKREQITGLMNKLKIQKKKKFLNLPRFQ